MVVTIVVPIQIYFFHAIVLMKKSLSDITIYFGHTRLLHYTLQLYIVTDRRVNKRY